MLYYYFMPWYKAQQMKTLLDSTSFTAVLPKKVKETGMLKFNDVIKNIQAVLTFRILQHWKPNNHH